MHSSPFSAIPFLDQAIRSLLQSFNLPLDPRDLSKHTDDVMDNLDDVTRVRVLSETDLVWKMAYASLLILSANPSHPRWAQETLNWISSVHEKHHADPQWKQWLSEWKSHDKNGQQYESVMLAPQDTAIRPSPVSYSLLACESKTPLHYLEDRFDLVRNWKASKGSTFFSFDTQQYVGRAMLDDPSSKANPWRKIILISMLDPSLIAWMSTHTADHIEWLDTLAKPITEADSILSKMISTHIELHCTPWIVNELQHPIVFQNKKIKSAMLTLYAVHHLQHKCTYESTRHTAINVPDAITRALCDLPDASSLLPTDLYQALSISNYNHVTRGSPSVFELLAAYRKIQDAHPEGLPNEIMSAHLEWISTTGMAGFIINSMPAEEVSNIAEQEIPIATWTALRLTQQLDDSNLLGLKSIIQPALLNCLATDPELFPLFQKAFGQEKPGYLGGDMIDSFVRQRGLPIDNLRVILDQSGYRYLGQDTPLKIPTLEGTIVTLDPQRQAIKPYHVVTAMLGQERYDQLKQLMMLSFDMEAPIAIHDLYSQYIHPINFHQDLPALTSLAQPAQSW